MMHWALEHASPQKKRLLAGIFGTALMIGMALYGASVL